MHSTYHSFVFLFIWQLLNIHYITKNTCIGSTFSKMFTENNLIYKTGNWKRISCDKMQEIKINVSGHLIDLVEYIIILWSSSCSFFFFFHLFSILFTHHLFGKRKGNVLTYSFRHAHEVNMRHAASISF